MTDQYNTPHSEDSLGIDFKQLLDIFKDNLKIIALTTMAFALLSVTASLNIPNVYSSRTILTITEKELGGGSTSGAGAGLGGIAAMAGIQIASSPNDLSFIVIETVKSHDFFKHLIQIDGVLENIYAAEGYDFSTGKILFDNNIFDASSKKWLIAKPTYVSAYGKYISSINISKNKTNGFLYLNFKHFSPQFAKDFTNLMVREINNVIRKKDLQDSSRSMKFLKAKLRDTNEIEIRLTINELIKSDLKTQTFANIKEHYAVEPIDTAYLPFQKTSPARALICIFGTIIGFIFSYLFFVVRSLLSQK
jgi:LPS O-antigen subunit length determinant protein (WzzB/FepE family)